MFKHMDRPTGTLPNKGDMVEAVRFINVRKGYSQYDKAKRTWVRQPVIGVLSSGDQVKVLGRKELGTSVVWIEFELQNPGNESKTPITPTAAPTPLSAESFDDRPSIDQAKKLRTIGTPRTGHAYYGSSQQYNFRQVAGGYQDDPRIGDVIEATVEVNARKGYIQYIEEKQHWINRDAIGLIEPGDKLKVLDVYRPIPPVIWVRYELLEKSIRSKTNIPKPENTPKSTPPRRQENENPVEQTAPPTQSYNQAEQSSQVSNSATQDKGHALQQRSSTMKSPPQTQSAPLKKAGH